MTTILSLLRNLKLTLVEWLALSLAVAFGGLVAALKVQGSRLHAAQVELLQQRLQAREQQDAKDSTAALAVYQKERDAYVDAGGAL